jgi:hypothetical protein
MFITRWVYQPPSVGRRLAAVALGVAGATAAILIAAIAGGSSIAAGSVPGLMVREGLSGPGISAAVLAVFGIGLTYLGHSRHPGRFGLRRPDSAGFLAALPLTALLAVVGGSWFAVAPGTSITLRGVAVLLVAIVGIEALLRGAVHGHLLRVFPVMTGSGRVFVSIPNLVSAVVFACAATACLLPPDWLTETIRGWWAVWFGAALIVGLICGGVREWWRSLWAVVILHAASAIAAWVVFSYWL